VEQLGSTGVPLGIMPGYPFEMAEPVRLQCEDSLIIVTDGLFEWHDSHGDDYGVERLGETLSRYRGLPAAGMIEKTYEELLSFARGEPQADDLTAVVVKRL
jgi:serine phosphatase RsbU (regulator of sigma subunit)